MKNTFKKFSTPLVLVTNRLNLMGQEAPDRLLIQHETIMTCESQMIYQTEQLKQIGKGSLLKLRKRFEGWLPDYEVYCLPEDVEKATDILHQAVSNDLKKMAHYVNEMVRSVDGGFEVKDKAQILSELNRPTSRGQVDDGGLSR